MLKRASISVRPGASPPDLPLYCSPSPPSPPRPSVRLSVLVSGCIPLLPAESRYAHPLFPFDLSTGQRICLYDTYLGIPRPPPVTPPRVQPVQGTADTSQPIISLLKDNRDRKGDIIPPEARSELANIAASTTLNNTI